MSSSGDEGQLVIIVEDDAAIAEGLSLNLRLQGYRTEAVGDGPDGAYAHRRGPAGSGLARHLVAQAKWHLGSATTARSRQPRTGDRTVRAR